MLCLLRLEHSPTVFQERVTEFTKFWQPLEPDFVQYFDTYYINRAAPLSTELVSCQLSPVADPTLIVRCVIHQVAPGSFEVCYSPPTAGLHQLKVQVGGTDILDSPLIKVMPRRAERRFTGLSSPRGLAITREGHLVVAEYGKHCITIIDPTDGKKINSFGENGQRSKRVNDKYKYNSAVHKEWQLPKMVALLLLSGVIDVYK